MRTAKEEELARLRNLRAQRRAAQQEEARIWTLVGREQELWNKTEEILATNSAHRNNNAAKLLQDLKALHDRWPTERFPEKLEEFRRRYANRPTLLAAMAKGGL